MDRGLSRQSLLMMAKHRTRYALPLLATAAVLVASYSFALKQSLLLPRWIAWQEHELLYDLDNDGTKERIELKQRAVAIYDDQDAAVYRSNNKWRVSDFLITDIDSDGYSELVMLIWRRGNYGTSRPFWETSPDYRWTEHLYVMRLEAGALRPVWMGHELGVEVSTISVAQDLDQSLVLTATDGTQSTWRWSGFGFYIE